MAELIERRWWLLRGIVLVVLFVNLFLMWSLNERSQHLNQMIREMRDTQKRMRAAENDLNAVLAKWRQRVGAGHE